MGDEHNVIDVEEQRDGGDGPATDADAQCARMFEQRGLDEVRFGQGHGQRFDHAAGGITFVHEVEKSQHCGIARRQTNADNERKNAGEDKEYKDTGDEDRIRNLAYKLIHDLPP